MFRVRRFAGHGGLRQLLAGQTSTLTVVILLTLTQGIGTATYSVVDGVALRQLPYVEPSQLIAVSARSSTTGSALHPSPRQYFAWKGAAQSLVGLGASRLSPPLLFESAPTSELIETREVTADLFTVLGIRPVAGRFFSDADGRPGGPAVAVIGYSLWQRRFNRDPDVIGRTLLMGGLAREVIGILPAGVVYPITSGAAPELYVPWVATERDRQNSFAQSLSVVGRLRHDVTVEQARLDFSRLDSNPSRQLS